MKTRLAAVGIAASGALILAGCGAANETAPAGGSGSTGGAPAVSGTISGAGASTQQAATQAWVAGFQKTNPDATINYDPSGSGAGRTQFIAGGVDWAGSDAYIKGDEATKAASRCGGGVVEVPVYVSPIAVVYNLQGVDNLQLSPSTIAKIFAGKITTWNDPAIAADNPGVNLPATAIAPVHRGDKSGTTQNFTDYLSGAAKADWPSPVADTWPIQGGEAAQGTSGVIGAVKGGQGTIGYADESQAKGLCVAKVKVGDAWVAPSAEGAAKVLEASQRVSDGGDKAFAYKLDRATTAPGAYPVTLVSYAIACAKYTDPAKADLVRAYLGYVVSADGQAAAASAAGSAPLPGHAGLADHARRSSRSPAARDTGRPWLSEAGRSSSSGWAPGLRASERTTETTMGTTSTAPPPAGMSDKPVRQPGDRIFADLARGAGVLILIVLAGVAAVPGRPGDPRLHRVHGRSAGRREPRVLHRPADLRHAAVLDHRADHRRAARGGGRAVHHALRAAAAGPVAQLRRRPARRGAVDRLRPLGARSRWRPPRCGLADWLNQQPRLAAVLRRAGVGTGRTMLVVGITLAVMILPIITAVSREVFLQTPKLHEEAALALGATRWEMIRMAVLPFGRSGIISGAMLGLGPRARRDDGRRDHPVRLAASSRST